MASNDLWSLLDFPSTCKIKLSSFTTKLPATQNTQDELVKLIEIWKSMDSEIFKFSLIIVDVAEGYAIHSLDIVTVKSFVKSLRCNEKFISKRQDIYEYRQSEIGNTVVTDWKPSLSIFFNGLLFSNDRNTWETTQISAIFDRCINTETIDHTLVKLATITCHMVLNSNLLTADMRNYFLYAMIFRCSSPYL